MPVPSPRKLFYWSMVTWLVNELLMEYKACGALRSVTPG